MHWTLFAFAGLALLGAHLLRMPVKCGLFGKIFAFLAGLVVMALAIKLVTGALGIGRTTDFDSFVNHGVAVAEQTDAPLILFSGASFSRNAIDEERLTLALNERGYPHQVISLSLEAASLTERQAHIEQFLKASPRAPDIVFVEVAHMTDQRPTFIFGNSKFSTRAIEQFGVDETLWTAMGLIGGGCEGPADCVKESGFLGLHALMNALNIGLLSKGELASNAPAKISYDGVTKPRVDVAPQDRSKDLSVMPSVAPRDALKWARSFRALQREELQAEGVGKVAYYFPPVLPVDERDYVSGLCAAELADFTCIAPDDPELLIALDADVWLDTRHLLDDGTAIYSRWLVDQMIESGVLEDGA